MSFEIETPKRFRAFISDWSLANNEFIGPTKEFLEKEVVNIKLSAGRAKIKVNKALEKSLTFQQLEKIEIESKA